MNKVDRRTFIAGAAGASLLLVLSPKLIAGLIEQSAPIEEPGDLPVENEEPEPVIIDCDYLLTGGLIFDGRGSEPFTGSVGIKGEEIVALGDFIAVPEAQVIDITGLYIAPGFIDLHTHTENYLRKSGQAEMILLQGVTSHIGGNCGTSVDSIAAYFNDIETKGVGINSGLFVGYKTVRKKYAGTGKTTPAQLEQIKEELRQGLEAGAFGLSTGLQYWPQSQATTQEIIELCKVLKDYNAFYSTHIRNEEHRVIPSVEEAIKIGFEAGVPVQYSHIKTAQKANWGKMAEVLKMVEEASQAGLDITADVYGYTFSSLDLDSGRYSMSEEDLILALKHPLVMVGSDSWFSDGGKPNHPRTFGNYPRILRKYVREEQILTWGEAIKKMTSMPAKRLGLKDRGILEIGYKADVVVFDPQEITDCSTRQELSILAKGMQYVFVNGKPAVAEGMATGILAGQVLKNSHSK